MESVSPRAHAQIARRQSPVGARALAPGRRQALDTRGGIHLHVLAVERVEGEHNAGQRRAEPSEQQAQKPS
jgi:hypothetical protein